MTWLYLFLFLGAALAIGRIVYQVRRLRQQPVNDWDAKLIERLRRSGADPFRPHAVDFFLAMPSAAAAQQVAARLGADGFSVDVREVSGNPGHAFSVHAQKSMQLSLDVVRENSARFRAIAAEHGGRYDGWATGQGSPAAG
jgi:regulator of RNase E activity RraB